MINDKNVLVGMSGGVDSSISAYLLKEQGYNVFGITFKLTQDETRCCEIENVKNIAQRLGITHYVVDISDVFSKMVIEGFVSGYKNGITPNPCIMCNKYIKFDYLLKKAGELGIKYIATGHYARIENGLLKKGIDSKKDQSYFLYSLKQAALKSLVLPLGNYTKDNVKKKAAELRLPIKNESQEICFIPDNNYERFLKEKYPDVAKEGHILDKNGNILGIHQGIAFFTIGQRKRMGISKKVPLYVIEIDRERNAIIVGEQKDLYKDELYAKDVNLFVDIDIPIKVSCKIRSQSKESSAIVSRSFTGASQTIAENKVRVKFEKPQFAITPGQSVVFYENDVIIGGGIIE